MRIPIAESNSSNTNPIKVENISRKKNTGPNMIQATTTKKIMNPNIGYILR